MFVRCSSSSFDILAAAHPKHTQTNRCHSERDRHRSTATHLWNPDTSSSNHTKAAI